MAKEREGKLGKINPDEKITYKKIFEVMRKEGNPKLETSYCLTDGWMFEMDYRGFGVDTNYFCSHEPGYFILMVPIYPRLQEHITNGQRIKNIMDKTIGYMPCCRFETSTEDLKDVYQAYVYSDEMSDDECFNQFKAVFEASKEQNVKLEKMKSGRELLN